MLYYILVLRSILSHVRTVANPLGTVFSLTVLGIIRPRTVLYTFYLIVFILSCTVLNPYMTVNQIVDVQLVTVLLLFKIQWRGNRPFRTSTASCSILYLALI